MRLEDELESHEDRVVASEIELATEVAGNARLKRAARAFVNAVRAFVARRSTVDREASLRFRVASHLVVEDAVKRLEGGVP